MAILFLPWVSEILPQTGAITPAIKKHAEKTRADHTSILDSGAPNSSKYTGKNGMHMV